MEKFKDTDYLVTTCGRIWSDKVGRFLKPRINKKGYLSVILTIDGRHISYQVHRLVASVYIPNIDNKPEVNHKDGIKSHNWINNLEWSTGHENMKHAYATGLREPVISNNKKVMLTLTDGTEKKYNSISEASRDTGLSVSGISHILNGYRDASNGYIWRWA